MASSPAHFLSPATTINCILYQSANWSIDISLKQRRHGCPTRIHFHAWWRCWQSDQFGCCCSNYGFPFVANNRRISIDVATFHDSRPLDGESLANHDKGAGRLQLGNEYPDGRAIQCIGRTSYEDFWYTSARIANVFRES